MAREEVERKGRKVDGCCRAEPHNVYLLGGGVRYPEGGGRERGTRRKQRGLNIVFYFLCGLR